VPKIAFLGIRLEQIATISEVRTVDSIVIAHLLITASQRDEMLYQEMFIAFPKRLAYPSNAFALATTEEGEARARRPVMLCHHLR